jgi:D-apionolactonase
VTSEFSLGDLQVTIDGVDLRDIRWQGLEAVRRIYPVFQDRNWTNRPLRINEFTVDSSSDFVNIEASGTGSFDAAALRWRVHAQLSETGIEYHFTAETTSSFLRNRLGLCVLHPMSAAGSTCQVEHIDGSATNAAFPEAISPDQPFVDIRAITHALPNGGSATVRMTGDTFEMEDHRNWTDASFKTYCTPISLPFPVEVIPGAIIEQRVSVTFTPGAPATAQPSDTITISIDDHVTDLPRLGTCLSAEAPALTDTQVERFTTLRLDHLRIDLDPIAADATEQLAAAATSASQIGARLRVSTICHDPVQLHTFADTPPDVSSLIDCWYVFSSSHKVTPADWASTARTALGPGFNDVRLGGGTNLYFTELNRDPPDTLAFDVLNFSINPQVHAFDDRTLIQNASTQQVVAVNAALVTEPAELSVAPITLRPRFNPNATDPASDVSNTALPSDVDERQRTYFTANWTAMSIKYLAAANCVDVATYFEAVGWKGLMESPAGCPDPAHFSSEPGEPFPVWQVFAALADMTHAHMCTSSGPEQVDALIVSDDSGASRALIANWIDSDQTVAITGYGTFSVPGRALTVVDLPATL